jgi:FkbM family methyltransferase
MSPRRARKQQARLAVPKPPSTLTSWAQNREDIRLWRALSDVSRGFYVDVGAADPWHHSVTALFYEHGWNGVNVEPGTAFDRLSKTRVRDINVRVAIDEAEGEAVLTTPLEGPGLASIRPFAPTVPDRFISNVERQTVRIRRLADVLEESEHSGDIHFLKVDVEGAESAVITSNDWRRFKPWIVVVESMLPLSSIAANAASWRKVLRGNKYRFAYFDGVNDYWLRADQYWRKEIIRAPISALDDFVDAEIASLREEEARLHRALEDHNSLLDHYRRCVTAAEEELRAVVELISSADEDDASRLVRMSRLVVDRFGKPNAPDQSNGLPAEEV